MRLELWGTYETKSTTYGAGWLLSRHINVQSAKLVEYYNYAALATGKIWVRI